MATKQLDTLHYYTDFGLVVCVGHPDALKRVGDLLTADGSVREMKGEPRPLMMEIPPEGWKPTSN